MTSSYFKISVLFSPTSLNIATFINTDLAMASFHFLKTFIVVTGTNLILNNAHFTAKHARYGMIPAEEAVTEIMKTYGLFFILFFAVIFITDYFTKKKASNTDTADQ